MYGTVARVQVLPGKEQALVEFEEQVARDYDPLSGQIACYIFKLDKGENEFLIAAIFRDRESYHRNAQAPETDRQYRMMRELLAADPEWNDGEIVQEFHY